jgi:hypothetical protein
MNMLLHGFPDARIRIDRRQLAVDQVPHVDNTPLVTAQVFLQDVSLFGDEVRRFFSWPKRLKFLACPPCSVIVLGGLDQHATRANRGVADPHPLLGLQQLDDELHDHVGCIELAPFLPGSSANFSIRYS